MYRTPSSRKRNKKENRLNLIPILDAIFIFIFFLLMSASFFKVYEIQSDVPIVSDSPPPKNQKPPLALTISIYKSKINIATGVPSRVIKSFENLSDGVYDVDGLHDYLIKLKKNHLSEKTALMEPKYNMSYDDIVKVMDAVRMFKDTDEALFEKDKNGLTVKVEKLFGNIIFSNVMSN